MSENHYKEHHRPASEFKSRSDYLDHELQIMRPRRWRLNLPGRDFRFELEDLVPALSGTIAITAMYSTVMTGWAQGLSDKYSWVELGSEFIVQATRVEMIVPAFLFCFLLSGFLNPRANLAGNHGPMITLIPLIALAGGHPLALAFMLGIFGLILSYFKGGSKLVNLTSSGVAGGLLVYLGATGSINTIVNLKGWSKSVGFEGHVTVILIISVAIYAVLAKLKKRWLAIPLCAITALVLGLSMGLPFEFTTTPGIPNLNPMHWWGSTETGWMLGMPNFSHFIASLPWAILAVAMWSPDFLGHRIFQELNYPPKTDNVLMDVDDTMVGCSLRQMVGTTFGGGNITSSWGTYMIPAAIAKRPIPAGAALLGVFCIIVAITGYPMDLFMFPPTMRIALLVGVFLPLLEAGMQMIKKESDAQAAGICVFSSIVVNPVFGWALTMLLDNTGMLGNKERSERLSKLDRWIIPLVAFLVCTIAMLLVGQIDGIPALL
jgi:hypothetical protein